MSTVKSKKLQLGTDARATNNFTIYQPATPDGTLRVGQGNADNPTEVAKITSAGIFSSGHILQVVNKTISTQGSQTIGTTDTQIGTGTDFDITITPKGNGSKFIVTARWFGEAASGWNIVFNIHRDGVRINTGGATDNKTGLSMATQTYGAAADDNSTPEIMNLQTVDSTASTVDTPITYTLVAASNSARTMWTNRCFSATQEKGISELIVMEIAA
jgi:hypothetical protein